MTRVTTCKMMINNDHLQDHFAQVQMISGKMKQIEGGDEYDEDRACTLHILIQSTMVFQATDVIMMIMVQVQRQHWETGLVLSCQTGAEYMQERDKCTQVKEHNITAFFGTAIVANRSKLSMQFHIQGTRRRGREGPLDLIEAMTIKKRR